MPVSVGRPDRRPWRRRRNSAGRRRYREGCSVATPGAASSCRRSRSRYAASMFYPFGGWMWSRPPSMRPARRSCVRGEIARMCGTRHSFGGRPARRQRSPVVTGPPEGEAPVPTAAGGCEASACSSISWTARDRSAEACHKGAEGHQSVHERADDIQGEASSEDHRGSPGKGCQRRYLVASKITA
jgi:hypothetical protein